MNTRRINPLWLAVVGTAVAVVAIVVYYMSPERITARSERRRAVAEQKRFTARFDSLCDARLYPVVWRSGAFTKTEFDADCMTWTLTIRSQDWQRRSESSKTDLATRLFVTFAGVRAQAGDEADDLTLIIKDDRDAKVASCTTAGGVTIYK
jgi:hypothetical protein